MSKTSQRSPNLKFAITFIIIITFFTLLCTRQAFGIAHLDIAPKASTKYSLPLLLQSWSNNSILNTSSAGSPLSITKSMRNINETVPTPGERPYIAQNKDYVFSQNRTEISAPSNNSHTGEFGKGVKIAVVMPTFTAAAYNHA